MNETTDDIKTVAPDLLYYEDDMTDDVPENDEPEKGECFRSLYQYLFPLVVLQTSRSIQMEPTEVFQDMEDFSGSNRPLPFNKFLYKAYPGTNEIALNIVRPNFDTSYVIGYLNTKYTPVIIKVPKINNIPDEYGGKKRFWGIQMMDGWTNTFASAGQENNDKEGSYILTGPTWRKNNKLSNNYTPGVFLCLFIILLLIMAWLFFAKQCFSIDDKTLNIGSAALLVCMIVLVIYGTRKWRKVYSSPTDFVWVIIRIQCQGVDDAIENVDKIQRKFRAELLDESFSDRINKEYNEGMIVPGKAFYNDYCMNNEDCETMKYCNTKINECVNYDLKNCRSGYDCPDNHYCDTFEPNDGTGGSHECKPLKKCECKDTETGEDCTVEERGTKCECSGCSNRLPGETCNPASGRCMKKEDKGCLYDWDCETGYCKYNDFGIAEGGLFNRGAGTIATCQQPPCMNDDQCEVTGMCDFEKNVCTEKRKTVKCEGRGPGNGCSSSETCEDGICKHIPVDLNCASDSDCPSEHPRNLPFGFGKDKRGVKNKTMYCDKNSKPQMCKYKSQVTESLVNETALAGKTVNEVVNSFTAEYFYTFASWIMRNIVQPPADDPYKLQVLKSINMIQPNNMKIGLGGFSWKDLDTGIKANLVGSFKFGKLKLTKDILLFANRSTSLTQWTNFSSTETVGTYGNDYTTRAALASQGLGANPAKTAIYLSCRKDSSSMKSKLDGSQHDYQMVFDGRVCGVKTIDPPVSAFWSITVYDDNGFEVKNTEGITRVGSETGLKHEEDGTLILSFATENNDTYSNWVPIPSSAFSVLGRFYLPDKDIISGVWSLPGMDKIERTNCDDVQWADDRQLPSCKSIGYEDGISLKQYYTSGRYPIATDMNYVRQKSHQLTTEQQQCMMEPSSSIQPDDEDKIKPVANVRSTITKCLNNLAPEELTVWDTKGLINPEDKVPTGNNACPINSDTCCSACDKGQPCKEFNNLMSRSTIPKEDGGFEFGQFNPDILTTMRMCDKHLPTTPENTIEYKFGKMMLNDGWIGSALDTMACQPGIKDRTTKPCLYETKDGNMRGVPMSPSAYYNNAILATFLGGNELVGNMPACYNNLSETDKAECNI